MRLTSTNAPPHQLIVIISTTLEFNRLIIVRVMFFYFLDLSCTLKIEYNYSENIRYEVIGTKVLTY